MRSLPRVLAATTAALALALLPAVASAGTPGTWTRITPTTGQNIDQVTLGRGPDGVLNVAWKAKNAADPSKEDIAAGRIEPNGSFGGEVAVQRGWATLSNPGLSLAPTGLLLFYGGIRTTDPGETQNNLNLSYAPPAGQPWTLKDGTVADGGFAYGSNVSALTLADGTPLTAWGSTLGVFVHRGFEPGSGDPNLQDQLGGCCGYDPGISLEGSSGLPFIAWYSNASGREGVFGSGLNPATGGPTGPAQLMPGSQTNGQSSQQLDRTPLTGRLGKPGVYVAYPGGYPSQDRVLLWRIGSSSSAILARGAQYDNVTIGAAPDGKLWVLWTQTADGKPRIYARRSNADVTQFGATAQAAPPAGADAAWKLDVSAQLGRADVLGSFSTPGSLATWHTQIFPALSVKASLARLKDGRRRVTATVTDAGDPVSGATVKAGGLSDATDSKGKGVVTLGRGSGRFTVTATKAGFQSAKTRVG